jgi:hypothetical protein
MSHRYQLALLVCIALLVSLGFAATKLAENSASQLSRFEKEYTEKKMNALSSIILQPVEIPKTESSHSTEEIIPFTISPTSTLFRAVSVPANEHVIAMNRVNGDEYLVVTEVVKTDPEYTGITTARIYDVTEEKTLLLKEEDLETFLQSATFDMALDDTYVDVQLHGSGEGPFGWEEVIHEYVVPLLGNVYDRFPRQILTNENRIVARAKYHSSFLFLLQLETQGKTMDFKLKAKNSCQKEYTDLATALIVNGVEIPLKKPVSINCPVFGEGEATPTMPGLGAPSFEYGIFSFGFPWGGRVEIDLSEPSIIRSADFAKDYQLP